MPIHSLIRAVGQAAGANINPYVRAYVRWSLGILTAAIGAYFAAVPGTPVQVLGVAVALGAGAAVA